MPTYEYECQKCGNRFDVFQSMTAAAIKKCPKCKGKVTRLIGSGSGIIFKGSGFYATDYKKGKNKDAPSCPLKKGDKGNESCKGCPNTEGR